jgi:hypothetical protein
LYAFSIKIFYGNVGDCWDPLKGEYLEFALKFVKSTWREPLKSAINNLKFVPLFSAKFLKDLPLGPLLQIVSSFPLLLWKILTVPHPLAWPTENTQVKIFPVKSDPRDPSEKLQHPTPSETIQSPKKLMKLWKMQINIISSSQKSHPICQPRLRKFEISFLSYNFSVI